MIRIPKLHQATKIHPQQSGQLTFSQPQLDGLNKLLVGHVTLPQDPGYAADRGSFVGAFQSYPQLIVHCQSFSDVVHAIQFAKDQGYKPVCRSGGHNTAGYCINDEMVIDLSAISYVRVDPKGKTAWIGAGTQFGHVNSVLDFYGLHIPGAGCETVAVAGQMQGGGYGFTSLMFGLNCDLVAGVQMALANGRIVTASTEENNDLFWAVRGGTGNNFGIVLEIQYNLIELGQLWGFGFRWPMDTDENSALAAKALHLWQSEFMGIEAKSGLGCEGGFFYTEQIGDDKGKLPFLPHFVLRGMVNGDDEALSKILAPFIGLAPNGKDYLDIRHQGSYRDLNRYLLTTPTEFPANVPASVRMLAKAHIVDRKLTLEECSQLIDLYDRSPSKDNFIGFEPYGGAVNAVDPSATAFFHRRARLDAFAFFFWLREDERPLTDTYIQDFDKTVEPLSNHHSYQNYPSRDFTKFGPRYFGGNLGRLKDIKQTYDPSNFFTFPQGLSQA